MNRYKFPPQKFRPPRRLLSKKVIEAVTSNDVSQLKFLQESGENFSICDQNNNTLLHLAIQKQIGNSTLDAFKFLLSEHGLPIDDRNFYGYSPLMEAFGNGHDSRQYAIELIEAGCDIIEPFPDGNTALHLAIYNKCTEVAELLIEKGFDVDCQNSDGETPLHIACRVGSVEDIWMLLFYGADPNFAYINEAEYINYSSSTMINFFDIMIKPNCQLELKDFFLYELKYEKSFSLMAFIEAMECDLEIFYKLLEITSYIHYTYDDLKAFSQRISTFKSEMFSLFIKQFSYVMEDVFDRCRLDEFFICANPFYLENYVTNLFTILHSELRTFFLDEVNASGLPLFDYLLGSFATDITRLDLLTQVLCCLLSYGVDITAESIHSIYFRYGYCELFKILLHMDIKNINRCLDFKHAMPRIIYDVNFRIRTIINQQNYHEPTIYKLSEYFTLKNVCIRENGLAVPSLVELARNCSREYIIKKYKLKNSRQFYSILKILPIAEIHKKIISFEIKLYSV